MIKMKEKVTNMNPKKGFCNLILCFIILCIIAGVGTIAKFGGRISEAAQQIEVTEKTNEPIEQNGDINRRERNQEKEHDVEWEKLIELTTSDYVFLVCVAFAFWIILCIYWLYTTAYVVSKSLEVGANAWVFGVLTLAANILGLVCLWGYMKLHHICPGCGKLQPWKANNCSICGTAIYEKCPDCGSRISVKDNYCNGCGRKIQKNS